MQGPVRADGARLPGIIGLAIYLHNTLQPEGKPGNESWLSFTKVEKEPRRLEAMSM